jgi:hypothetical protein
MVPWHDEPFRHRLRQPFVGAREGPHGGRKCDSPRLEGESYEEWAREAHCRPRRPGDQIRIMRGNPADPDPVKRGPYVRISKSGKVSEPVPLHGNPTLRRRPTMNESTDGRRTRSHPSCRRRSASTILPLALRKVVDADLRRHDELGTARALPVAAIVGRRLTKCQHCCNGAPWLACVARSAGFRAALPDHRGA